MLIRNYAYYTSLAGHNHSGLTNPMRFITPHTMMGYFTNPDDNGTAEEIQKDSFPTATEAPYSIVMAFKGGLLSANNSIEGIGELTTQSLAKGVAIATEIEGSGDLVNASLSLIIQLAVSILGEATLSAAMVGKLEMASAMAGSGDLTSALSLIANVVTEMSGSGTIEATAFGTADMSATFSSSSTLSPENLAAAVWNSVAAAFNTAGTMGNKLNSAASAGDPWGTALPGSYLSTEAGGILARIQELVDELHQLEGLKSGSPMTVTPTSRTVGSINLEITGDGETLTQVERV